MGIGKKHEEFCERLLILLHPVHLTHRMERMSLSKHLQSPEILTGVLGKDIAAVRAYFIEKGMQ